MSVTLHACPNCQSVLSFRGGPVHRVQLDGIHLCGTCGLVYKPTSNPIDFAYTVSSWDGPAFELHAARIVDMVTKMSQFFPGHLAGRILDVGAGVGILREVIKRAVGACDQYVAVEPVADIAAVLANRGDTIVLNGDFNDCELPAEAFDIVFLCGVDYLFKDLRGAFEKVRKILKDTGVVVIQRNVFIDQKAYVGTPIRTKAEMFDPNPLMRNWFHSEQYPAFLKQFLRICHSWREYHRVETGGEASIGFVDTFLCTKTDAPVWEPASWVETNAALLDVLDAKPGAN